MRAEGMQVFSLFHPDNPMLSVGVFTNHPIEAAGGPASSSTAAAAPFSYPSGADSSVVLLKLKFDTWASRSTPTTPV